MLVMPLSSESDDRMEVDLGTLQLSNLVVWEMRSEDKDRQKLLVDEMQVCAYAVCVLEKVSWCGLLLNSWQRELCPVLKGLNLSTHDVAGACILFCMLLTCTVGSAAS